jgi:hypothetical protein
MGDRFWRRGHSQVPTWKQVGCQFRARGRLHVPTLRSGYRGPWNFAVRRGPLKAGGVPVLNSSLFSGSDGEVVVGRLCWDL